MSELQPHERQAVIATMAPGFAPGSPRGWRTDLVTFSHLIDPTTRAPRCAGYMYHGDSIVIGIGHKPTCPGCVSWSSQFGADDEGASYR